MWTQRLMAKEEDLYETEEESDEFSDEDEEEVQLKPVFIPKVIYASWINALY